MPRRISYRLQWFAPNQEYTVFHDGRLLIPHVKPVGSHWFDWLETISSFSFQSRYGGSCTVRKETVQRGGTYWYAYRRKERRMVKRYLARSTDLTLARLEMITAALNDAEVLSGSYRFADVEEYPQESAEETRATLSPESSPPFQMLLTTKLLIPRLPVQYVSRPRLLTLLQQGIQKPLTLVSAPAGSGKTTLLAEWASTTNLPVAWISLEPTDNDPLVFLSYLKAALASLDTSIDCAMRAYQCNDVQDIKRVLTGILNDLTYLLKQDAVVILDDYHVLTANTIHSLLHFLLDHLSPHFHLIIGTRVDPPLHLARLRARGQLSEVRTEALRFVSGEVEALVRTMGLALSSEATSLLEQRTEGWIAGVQLLSLALRAQPDATAFLQTFRGTHRFFLDYVSEEVLTQQTPETQRFLLLTSILDRMMGPLCDAVTELPGPCGQTRLEALLRANLFISALDDTQTWYRYHPLFANALRAQLQKLEPELIPRLYQRASDWYEQQERREEACDYAFLAGDLPRAARLVARILPHMVEQGRFERLKYWLSQLPPDLIATSPQLYITLPWLHALSKRTPEHAERALQSMEQYVQGQQQSEAASWAEPQSVLTLFRALTALSQSNPLQAFNLVREALRTLTSHETDLSLLLRRFLQIILSLTYGVRGDLVAAEHILLNLSVSQSAESLSLIHMAATFLLGELRKAQSQLRKAGTLYDGIFWTFGARQDLPSTPLLLVSFTLMRRACLLYEWNRLPEAASAIQQVVEVIPRVILEIIPPPAQSPLYAFGLWVQARIELAQGQPEAAKHFLELVRKQPEIGGELPQGKERSPVDVPTLAARLALACDQVEEAEYWIGTCGIRYDDAPVTLLESRQMLAYLTLARILIVRGRAQRTGTPLSQALVLLENWRDCASRLGFHGWLIEVQVLTALALQAQGKTRQALVTLGPVLAQAEREGYIRLFADEGQPMARLLAQVSAYTTASPGYVQQLQATIPFTHQMALGSTQPEASQSLIEPLSAREVEVLSLLANGASNQQIADHLVISLNTAKRHVKHILAKLSVTNRTQAVARAHALHLLE
ncbi:helix-turn-helix transcriptional regulator [Ktedonobacter sp. SOSP1-52]|uniref:LuxR C-terminal-related transcriptional regulator n=1 Tax=Ktedonobacter sp. SOSP1-52 TaxID=2778366 RepID=UPI001915A984|nr:LuxR C-terminal-related transcriptional regulator [Ktedonobacter sp. SOSP1-52]GHO71986.1 helix-turn-helix transcriptional regulator [Ktedonobacter sp. SOSP1-52]